MLVLTYYTYEIYMCICFHTAYARAGYVVRLNVSLVLHVT